ncbi:MAG: arginine--tRNA ligase [Flaviaesturariibacter sp.]|nr:arginine--tRNA ligase [Flaviaesturariibacter sp.]
MSLVARVKEATAAALESINKLPFYADDVVVSTTKPEFEGDYTVVLFSLVKRLGKQPEALGNELGAWLTVNHGDLFTAFNVIKGFLNLTLADSVLLAGLETPAVFRPTPSSARKVMVEYSSPNTNKPLHLGHLRNNFLGWSVAEILKAAGHDVRKTCIVNDRGIHICKSMIAWQLFGDGATPQSTTIKGDHLVGDYYVRCETAIKEQYETLLGQTKKNDYSGIEPEAVDKLQALHAAIDSLDPDKEKEKRQKLVEERKELLRAQTPIMLKARQMLVDWENGKPEVIELWKKMNAWVYKGFDETYKRIGTDFDKTYYESETYLLGRRFVDMGVERGVFFRKEDGSVWIDLTAEGLDEKLVLRKDGTSVYITQDLGLAHQKYEEFPYDQSIYVIADEQNYHMKVLKLILQKLDMPYAGGIEHLSYGMVELPSGRMKSREGTVVDADDIVAEMVRESETRTAEKSNPQDFTPEELTALYETIGLGALKFFLLKVDPKKKMVFNPEESIDFHGFTGPFIQYTHARLRSILRKESPAASTGAASPLFRLEKELMLLLEQYPAILQEAASSFSPAVIANYIYAVARTCNSFYTEHKVLKAESEEKKQLRLRLCERTADTIREGMHLLGIRVPERM